PGDPGAVLREVALAARGAAGEAARLHDVRGTARARPRARLGRVTGVAGTRAADRAGSRRGGVRAGVATAVALVDAAGVAVGGAPHRTDRREAAGMALRDPAAEPEELCRAALREVRVRVAAAIVDVDRRGRAGEGVRREGDVRVASDGADVRLAVTVARVARPGDAPDARLADVDAVATHGARVERDRMDGGAARVMRAA